MSKLTEPTPQLAQKMTSELEYAERLVGHQMSPATGNQTRSLYSLQEVTRFLRVDDYSELIAKGGGTSIGYIDPTQLRNWVERVYDDQELVAAIDEQLGTECSLSEKLNLLKGLLKERLDGCNAVLAAQEDTQDDKEGQYA